MGRRIVRSARARVGRDRGGRELAARDLGARPLVRARGERATRWRGSSAAGAGPWTPGDCKLRYAPGIRVATMRAS